MESGVIALGAWIIMFTMLLLLILIGWLVFHRDDIRFYSWSGFFDKVVGGIPSTVMSMFIVGVVFFFLYGLPATILLSWTGFWAGVITDMVKYVGVGE